MALPRPPSTINIGGRVISNPFYSPPGTLIGTSPGTSAGGASIVTPGQIISGGGSSGGSYSGGGTSRAPVYRTVDSVTQKNIRDLQSQGFSPQQISQTIKQFTPSDLASRISNQGVAGDSPQAVVARARAKQLSATEQRLYDEQVGSLYSQYEEGVSSFNTSFGGRQLTQQEYDRAVAEQKRLEELEFMIKARSREFELASEKRVGEGLARIEASTRKAGDTSDLTRVLLGQKKVSLSSGQVDSGLVDSKRVDDVVRASLVSGRVPGSKSVLSSGESFKQDISDVEFKDRLAKVESKSVFVEESLPSAKKLVRDFHREWSLYPGKEGTGWKEKGVLGVFPAAIGTVYGATTTLAGGLLGGAQFSIADQSQWFKQFGQNRVDELKAKGIVNPRMVALQEFEKKDKEMVKYYAVTGTTASELIAFDKVFKVAGSGVKLISPIVLKVPGVAKLTSATKSFLVSEHGFGSVIEGTNKLLTPTIKFKEYSPIKQEILSAGKKLITVKGSGTIISEQAGLKAKLISKITRKPLKFTTVKTPISYESDVIKKYVTSFTGKTGKISGNVSPQNLLADLPSEQYLRLLRKQKLDLKAFRGRVGFESNTRLTIGSGSSAEVLIIKDFQDAFVKKARVSVRPIGIEKGDPTSSVFSFKKLNVSVDSATSSKVKGVLIGDKQGFIVSKVRSVGGGIKAKVSSSIVKVKDVKSVFDVGKVKVVSKSKPASLLQIEKGVKKIDYSKLNPVTAKDKELFKVLSSSPVKEGKWAFKPKSNLGENKKLLDLIRVKVKPKDTSVFKPLAPDSPNLKIYKVIKGQLRRVNKPVVPKPVTKESKRLFAFLDKANITDKTGKPLQSLFKIKRSEVKAVDLIRKPVTKESKALAKYLSSKETPSLLKSSSVPVKKIDYSKLNPVTAKDKELFTALIQTDSQGKQVSVSLASVKPKILDKSVEKFSNKQLIDASKIDVVTSISKDLEKSITAKGSQKAKDVIRSFRKPLATSIVLVDDYSVPQVIPSEYASSRTSPVFGQKTLEVQKVKFDSKIAMASLVKQESKVGEIQKVKIGSLQSSKSMLDQAVKSSQAVKISQATAIAQAVKTSQASMIKNALKQKALTKTKTATRTMVRTGFVTPRLTLPPIKVIPPFVVPLPRFGVAMFSDAKQKRLRQVFDVEVRKKGKFVKVATGLPKGLAKRLGKSITDETIARTFQLKPVGFKKTRDIPLPNLSQYRVPARRSSLNQPLTFVEKSRFAISTSTEKRTLRQARLKGVFDY